MKYAVICETGPEGGFSAYAPDLPGCVAAARTLSMLDLSWKKPSNSISREFALTGSPSPSHPRWQKCWKSPKQVRATSRFERLSNQP